MITYKRDRFEKLRLILWGKRIADVWGELWVRGEREDQNIKKQIFFFLFRLPRFFCAVYLYFLNLIFVVAPEQKKKFMLLFREIFQKPTPYLLLSFLEFFQDVSNLELNFLFCSPIRRICEWRKSTVFCFLLCLRF